MAAATAISGRPFPAARRRGRGGSLAGCALAGALVAVAACDPGGEDPEDGGGDDDTALLPDDRLAVHAASRYDYGLVLETRAAHAAVTLEVLEPGGCVSLPHRAEAPTEVRVDGAPARDVRIDGGVLTACEPSGLTWEAGESVVLEAWATVPEETWAPLQVGFSVTEDGGGHPFTYLLSWVGGCDRHGPCDPSPAAFATYRFTVEHPEGTRVLCPGELQPGQTVTVCDFPWEGGPTYSAFAVMASPAWEEVPLGDWDGVEAVLYDLPSSTTARDLEVELVSGFLAWMGEEFGPYPYGEQLRFAVGPTYWAGFEHPGNILLAEGLGSSTTHVALHEVAHQWAGDQTTLADTYDFVWKEAMAEYLSFVYEEQVDPERGAQTAARWKSYSRGAGYYPVPDERPDLPDYYGEVYGPGPLVLFRQVEAMFGREAVLGALRSLLGAQRALSVEDVRVALEQATGADLTGYFDAWVYGSGAPAWPTALATAHDEGEGRVQVELEVFTGDGVPRGCAFDVRLEGEAGETYDVRFDLGVDGDPPEPVIVEPGFAVADVVIDPRYEALVYSASAAAAPRPERPMWVAP